MTIASERSGLFEGAFKAAFEHSMDGVLITVPDGRIMAANPAACVILGTTEDDICRRGRQGFSNPDDPRWVSSLEERSRTGHVRAVLPMHRADGTPFVAELASSVFAGPDGEPRSCVVMRDVTERVRLEQHLRATHEITQALLSGKDTSEVLGMIASHARTLVDATDAAIFRTTSPPGSVVVAAADGPRLSKLLGRSYPPGTLAAQILESGESLLVDDLSAVAVSEDGRRLGFGPGIVVPIISEGHAFGDLMVASSEPLRRPFGRTELAVVRTFAEAAGVALALGEARAEVERLAVSQEKRRIGAELHDSVIQRLFAAGLHLHQLVAQSPPEIAAKLEESVHQVNDSIIDIRRTISGIRSSDVEGGVGEGVERMAADAGSLLGFAPRVEVSGTGAIDPDTAGQLLLVLREALSNVVRHAGATEVDVSVSVDDEDVILCVTDNGVGPPEGPTHGWGLENMAQRAERLGGEFSLEPATPHGTRLEWRAPLGSGSSDAQADVGPSRGGGKRPSTPS